MIPTCSTLLFLVALPLLLEVEGFTAVPRLTLLSKSAATSSGRAKLRSVMTSMVATRDDEEAPILHRVQATGAVVPMPRAEVMVEALEQQLVHKKQRLLYLRKEMLELESQIKTEQDHLAITRAAHKKTHTHTHVHTHLHTHTPIAGQSSSEIPQSMTEGTAPSPDVPSRGQQAKKRAPGGVSRGGAPRGATLQDKQAATMTLIRGGHEVELREKMCARLGATYAILWKKKGERFMVSRDFTTESRKRALRATRGDDKTFSSESRKYTVPVNGRGPIASASRSGEEVIITDTSVMVRAAIAKEFGIRCIHFVPLPDGRVLEYGTPSGAEMLYAELLTQLIRRFISAPTIGQCFQLAMEIVWVLKALMFTDDRKQEETYKWMRGVRHMMRVAFQRLIIEHSNFQQHKKETSGRVRGVKRWALLRGLAYPFVWSVTRWTYAVENFNAWRASRAEKQLARSRQGKDGDIPLLE